MLRWIYILISFLIISALGLSDYLLPGNLFTSLHPDLQYFIDFFKIDEGLNILVGAYTVRFLIKRIHLIS